MNNPPAFPTSHQEPCDYNGHNNSKKTVIDQGMSLRDYMAAQAMLARGFTVRPYDTTNETAKDCYRMADAMLKAREA